jgi:hypothetical protein
MPRHGVETVKVGNDGLGGLPLETLLHWHLTANHYPPLPTSLIPCCIRSIELAASGQWTMRVRLPRGIVNAAGGRYLPAQAIVEACRLEDFVDALAQSWMEDLGE